MYPNLINNYGPLGQSVDDIMEYLNKEFTTGYDSTIEKNECVVCRNKIEVIILKYKKGDGPLLNESMTPNFCPICGKKQN